MRPNIQPIEKIPRCKNKDKRSFAKSLRQRKTKAEDSFARQFQSWKARGMIDNVSLRSQRVIGPYIVDYLVPSYKACIEIDGSFHNKRGDYDYRRDKFIYETTGFRVFRFSNKLVEQRPEEVREKLVRIFNHFKEVGSYKGPSYSQYIHRTEKAV